MHYSFIYNDKYGHRACWFYIEFKSAHYTNLNINELHKSL